MHWYYKQYLYLYFNFQYSLLTIHNIFMTLFHLLPVYLLLFFSIYRYLPIALGLHSLHITLHLINRFILKYDDCEYGTMFSIVLLEIIFEMFFYYSTGIWSILKI